VLSAVLIVAERLLVNYGMCGIDINSGERLLEVDGGQTLLSGLIGQGIFIPSACGGRGTCAYCKVKIAGEGLPVLPTEAPLLTEEEKEEDVHLSCQVKIRDDMAIEIPEELFNIREFRGLVESITELTHDIKGLRIALIEPKTIEFTAGQYVQLACPPYGDNPETVYRAYSISSPPSDNDHIELIIRLAPGGICTTWVFEHLSEGDEVTFNGPHGDFHLSDTDMEMLWIAGGSGMAPFWSILRHMHENDIQRKATYFFGAVQERDLFLTEEIREIQEDMPNFRFIPALSGESDFQDWDGERGLITEVVDRHVTSAEGKEGYLCGSAGMIDASVKVLTDKGIPEERIYYDKFN
jgi:Na+-transporting NADH:ubiquinone oxidoreductase subunit F